MLYNRKRMRHRILQVMYRPKVSHGRFISGGALAFLDDLENALEEKVTPLLSDFF
ncbi:MAG: hypothetical protein FWG38_02725 [Defluviitaleaceae bacterium]|nr:hypothetical protein [Defluviitaleaceae bacterium]